MKKRAKSSVIDISGQRAGTAPSTKGTVERRAGTARRTKGAVGRDSERGIALILTLAILVLVTLLVVAFAVSMRVENTASKNFNDLIKARQLAQAGVDQAVAAIGNATPPITPTANYVTAPGAIYTWRGAPPWVPTALFTTGTINVNFNTNVDLNANNLITGVNSEYPTNPPPNNSPLLVGWTNVTMIGSSVMVGRFAYWVDDEAAKVDVNVAGSRGNDLQGYTPAAIDLQSLHFTTTDQTNITNYVSTVRPLDTIESLKMTAPPLVGPAPSIAATTFSSNQFYVTARSTSPDLTPWGDKRLNLAEVVNNNVLYPTTTLKIEAITNMLANVNLASWFGVGNTFATKYTNLAQIAANIIDYIDVDPPTGPVCTDSGTVGDTTPPLYLGLEETPYLNELVITNQIIVFPPNLVTGTGSLTFNSTAFVELWYMYTNASGWSPTVSTQIKLLAPPGISVSGAGTPSTISFSNLTISAGGVLHNLGGPHPSYDVTKGTLGSGVVGLSAPSPLTLITLSSSVVTGIYLNSAGRMDYATILLVGSATNIDTTATTGTVVNIIWAAACNDPRVKPVSNTWTPVGAGLPNPVTLGGPNTGVLNPSVSTTVNGVSVPGDGDFSCHIVSGSRDRGTMYPGELSFIHTGYPWRTLWLQPESPAELGPPAMIPDWVALDLFSATDATNVVGRMNINSAITNSDVKTFVLPGRTVPLFALLTNNLTGTVYNQGTAATNAYSYAYNASARPPGSPFPLFPNFSPYSYTMVGEIANTQSLSDTLPADATHPKSLRETPVRGIANLITTRSDIFTVWCIAQTIKKVDTTDPSHFHPEFSPPDIITGEAKVEAIVQRYEDDSTGTPVVKFRTLYYRYIYQ